MASLVPRSFSTQVLHAFEVVHTQNVEILQQKFVWNPEFIFSLRLHMPNIHIAEVIII